MANTLGQFMQPKAHSEVVDPSAATPVALPAPYVSAAPHPGSQPVPPLTSPAPIAPFEPPPPLSVTGTPAFEPAPGLSVPVAPPFEPAPPLSVPAVVPFQPAPPLRATGTPGFEAAPPLSAPAVVPFQPAPPLTTPVAPPAMAAPPLTTPAALPEQPAPPLRATGTVPFEPPPALGTMEQSMNDARARGEVFPGDPGCIAEAPTNPKRHSDLIAEANKEDNTIPGLIKRELKGALADIAGQLTNLSVSSQVSVATIPGIGGQPPIPLPLDLNVNTHGGKINVGVDLHFRETLRKIEDQGKTYAQERAKAFATQKIGAAVAALGLGGGASPGSFVPSPTPLDKQRQPPKTGIDPSDPPPPDTVDMPDWTVAAADPVLDYAARTRTEAQTLQKNVADMVNATMGQDQHAPYTAGRTLQQYFSDTGRDRTLITSMNAMSGSDNRLTVNFPKGQGGFPEERGFFRVQAKQGSVRQLPDDDAAYVPLVFTDLRQLQGGVYRSVYFRPFIKSLTEDFAPQWSMSNYFGRVDPVATYQSTNRTVNLAFTLTCFSQDELQIMYQKLGWLTSMVYPMYRNNVYFAGPVIRLRVGDVINAVGSEGNRGLPGVLTSLNYSYDDAIWELDKDSKVPRLIEVSLSFHVLHEYPIGVVRGVGGENSDNLFGGILPGGGPSGQKNAFVNIDRFRAAFANDYLNDKTLNAETPQPTAGTQPSTVVNGDSADQ